MRRRRRRVAGTAALAVAAVAGLVVGVPRIVDHASPPAPTGSATCPATADPVGAVEAGTGPAVPPGAFDITRCDAPTSQVVRGGAAEVVAALNALPVRDRSAPCTGFLRGLVVDDPVFVVRYAGRDPVVVHLDLACLSQAAPACTSTPQGRTVIDGACVTRTSWAWRAPLDTFAARLFAASGAAVDPATVPTPSCPSRPPIPRPGVPTALDPFYPRLSAAVVAAAACRFAPADSAGAGRLLRSRTLRDGADALRAVVNVAAVPRLRGCPPMLLHARYAVDVLVLADAAGRVTTVPTTRTGCVDAGLARELDRLLGPLA
ncbi:MAG TPA: hypothetical protein VI011_10810 [Asanoa sp.]